MEAPGFAPSPTPYSICSLISCEKRSLMNCKGLHELHKPLKHVVWTWSVGCRNLDGLVFCYCSRYKQINQPNRQRFTLVHSLGDFCPWPVGWPWCFRTLNGESKIQEESGVQIPPEERGLLHDLKSPSRSHFFKFYHLLTAQPNLWGMFQIQTTAPNLKLSG